MIKCPICSQRLHPGADRCPSCGFRIRQTDTPSPMPGTPAKRKTAALTVTLSVLFAFSLAFCLFSFAGSFVSRPIREPAAAPERPAVTMPVEEFHSIPPASEGCFVIAEGVLMFRPDQWDGSTILSVPDTVEGQTVTAIGPGCFLDCTELTTIVLPDTVTQIGPGAFAGCARLRGLFVPEGTVSIGRDAFAGCTALESVYIPSTVELIAGGCFDDCAALLYIFYQGTFESWNSLYSDYITPFTTAICLDGNYIHAAQG